MLSYSLDSCFVLLTLAVIIAMCRPSDAKAAADAASVVNSKWVLVKRPEGAFCPDGDVELRTERVEHSSLGDDEVLVESTVLSVDAFIRTMLDAEAYHGSVPIEGTLPAVGYGRVVAAGPSSKHRVGSLVAGALGAQTHARVKSKEVMAAMRLPFLPQTASLGLMGLTTGLTAYAGVFYVSRRPRRGETVVVTGAAGAVGSVASQLSKSTGARVVGVAGGVAKCAYLVDELGLDGAVDYKRADESLGAQLDRLCPDGIDFVYDNVGGETLDALLERIRPGGRVVICGAISQYSGNLNKGRVRGPSNYLKLAERGAEMRGFNVMQYMSRLPLMLIGMFYLYMRGKVRMTDHVETGIKSFPGALHKMFSGGHTGKLLVDVTGSIEKEKTE